METLRNFFGPPDPNVQVGVTLSAAPHIPKPQNIVTEAQCQRRL